MRKLIYAIHISLDGCCDHTNFYPDEEIMVYFTQLVRNADTFVYGRMTYELMVPYWLDAVKNPDPDGREVDREYALAFNAMEKMVVISTSLNSVEEKRTRIVSANIYDEILRLKQEKGKNILTNGITIPTQLAELGLIDEFHFIVHPVVAGEGRRLFEGINLQEKLKLKLVESMVFKSGAVALRYMKQ